MRYHSPDLLRDEGSDSGGCCFKGLCVSVRVGVTALVHKLCDAEGKRSLVLQDHATVLKVKEGLLGVPLLGERIFCRMSGRVTRKTTLQYIRQHADKPTGASGGRLVNYQI